MPSTLPLNLSSSYDANAPAAEDKVSASQLDSDHIAMEAWSLNLLTTLAQVIRDDDQLADGCVEARCLNVATLALIASKSAWKPKEEVACCATGNVALSGEQTIDGVITSSSRVLLVNQINQSQNGIWVTAAGSWSRASDAATASDLGYALVSVVSGTSVGRSTWVCILDGSQITLGVTSVRFTRLFSPVTQGLLGLSYGGTGASSPSTARSNLGISEVMDPVVTAASLAEARAEMGPWSDATVTTSGGSASRTLSDRFNDVINVLDYGCVGDGVTDDTSNMQAAIAAACVYRKDLVIPRTSSEYKLTATLGVTYPINIISDRARLHFGPAVTVGMSLDYDYVVSGWSDGEKWREWAGFYFLVDNANAVGIKCPYGAKSMRFSRISGEGVYTISSQADTATGLQIDGAHAGRKNWTSNQTEIHNCHFLKFRKCLNINGTDTATGGVDSLTDMIRVRNCFFESSGCHIRATAVHNLVIEQCWIPPSVNWYDAATNASGDFRVDIQGFSSGVTIRECYFENLGSVVQQDLVKIRLSPTYVLNANTGSQAPLMILYCQGISMRDFKDTSLAVSPVFDSAMPRTAGVPGLNNKKYRVIFIDAYGALFNNAVEAQSVIAGSNAAVVMHNPINDNVGGTGGISVNWNPYANKAVDDTKPVYTWEVGCRSMTPGSNFLSDIYQVPASGAAVDWTHSGVNPAYGTEFFKRWFNGDFGSPVTPTYQNGRIRLGAYYLWIDTSGRLRIKSSAPTSDTDGTVVGTQT